MVNNLNDKQIEEIVLSVIDSNDFFSIYNDDRSTQIWVHNMNENEIKTALQLLNEILIPLMSKPYTIQINTKPDDSEF